MLFLRKTDETTWKPPFLREPPSPFNQPLISEQFFLTPFLPNFQKRDSHPNIRSGEEGGGGNYVYLYKDKVIMQFLSPQSH